MSCGDLGLVLGAGTRLVRMADEDYLAIEHDKDRCLALLSVLCRRPVGAEVLGPIQAAATYWAAGDKALANLRLVFSGLPKLGSAADADRLEAAAYCLDQGLAPCDLMKALGLDPSVLDLRKYDPNQPRVPAGSGPQSGQWTDQSDDAQSDTSFTPSKPPSKPQRIRIAANGPFKPEGVEAVPSQSIDPLDPLNLNRQPPTIEEQEAIAATLSIIINGTPEEVKELQPHNYQNLPEKSTGAILPPDAEGYVSYNLQRDKDRGQARIVVNRERNAAYYTANHYLSFYGVDIDK